MSGSKIKICHLTSVHSRLDTRIFIKQCRSLSNHGFQTHLIVADGLGDEVKDGVIISGIPRKKHRLKRMLQSPSDILSKALALDCTLYHLHDPELIFIGLKLKRLGKIVIIDCHEDLAKQVLTKPYLNPVLSRIISAAAFLLERYAFQKFEAIVAATPTIRDKFLPVNPHVVNINNYPLIDELFSENSTNDKSLEVSYIGGISSLRGIKEIIQACGHLKTPTRLNLVGNFTESSTEEKVKGYPGWARVNEIGFLNRNGVREVLGRSFAGVVTFLPAPNHIDAQPNKMFEYMAAGIPVIASDFPLWREIVEKNDCGLCVDPLDPFAIASAIDFLATNPDVAERMGKNGRYAVLETYNWLVEEKKLLSLYSDVLHSA